MRKFRFVAFLLIVATVIGACGGGATPAPTTQPPAAAATLGARTWLVGRVGDDDLGEGVGRIAELLG